MAHHHMRPRILPPPAPSVPATHLDRLVDFARRTPVLVLAVTAGLALFIGLSVAAPRHRRR